MKHWRKLFLLTLVLFAIPQLQTKSQGIEVKSQTLNISGVRVKFDEIGLQYMATGNARAFIEGEKAAVEADEIRYNDLSGIMDVRGHVHFVRNGMITTGEEFKFKVQSKEYLVTEPASSNIAKPLITKLSITKVSVDHRKEDAEQIRLETEAQ